MSMTPHDPPAPFFPVQSELRNRVHSFEAGDEKTLPIALSCVLRCPQCPVVVRTLILQYWLLSTFPSTPDAAPKKGHSIDSHAPRGRQLVTRPFPSRQLPPRPSTTPRHGAAHAGLTGDQAVRAASLHARDASALHTSQRSVPRSVPRSFGSAPSDLRQTSVFRSKQDRLPQTAQFPLKKV
jgi:hypothetical protein